MRAMAVAGWHSAIQSGLERGAGMGTGEGARRIRMEVGETRWSIPPRWCHLGTGSGEVEEQGGTRRERGRKRGSGEDASGAKMTQLSTHGVERGHLRTDGRTFSG